MICSRTRRAGMAVILVAGFWTSVAAGQFGGGGGQPRERTARSWIGASEVRAMPHEAGEIDEQWSGSREDLERLVAEARKQYGFEASKHKGRNAMMLIPATLDELWREIADGNMAEWHEEVKDIAHQEKSVAVVVRNYANLYPFVNWQSGPDENVKYTAPDGREVVYNRATRRVVTSQLLGTKNFAADYGFTGHPIDHFFYDMMTHWEDGNYKYVGILYETDPNNPGKYYIVDGQTGRRMTNRQAEEFPTTLTDMWKEMGLMCVPEDAEDVLPGEDEENTVASDENQDGIASRGEKSEAKGAGERPMGQPCISCLLSGSGTCKTPTCPNFGNPCEEYLSRKARESR